MDLPGTHYWGLKYGIAGLPLTVTLILAILMVAGIAAGLAYRRRAAVR